MTTVALTGCSGLLGSNLLLSLVDDGHRVRATYRSEASIAPLRRALGARADHVDFVRADLNDTGALTAAFSVDGKGVDAVFHVAAMVSILRDVTPALVRANVDGTRNVIAAARAAGVRRLVHTSSTVCIGVAPAAGTDADETTTWNLREAGLADGYAVTKKDAEDLVLRAGRGADGAGALDVVVVNPGYLFGPHDARPSSGKLLLDFARGRVPGTTPGVNSFVDVRDVARGHVAAWQRGRSGERYILGGHNLGYTELFALVGSRIGRRPPRLSVPRLVGRAIGRLGDVQAAVTGREPLLTSAAIAWSFCDRFRVSSQKAQAELGYSISPLEGAVDAAFADFRSRGWL
ncbi:MAG: NAD-dependent epimerase/dehydratase family protein [Deltaproteobacteria bacterium]|nr:NAD-dependent epimerase/dehydratase family protein [Deltaproteobacteria bacterium]